jgi:hypothetical protein
MGRLATAYDALHPETIILVLSRSGPNATFESGFVRG